jgi:hypothetical protein
MSDFEDLDHFDILIERQVEQFNQHVKASANFHNYMLQALCVERMGRDFEIMHGHSPPPPSMRRIQPRPSLTRAGKSMRRQVGGVGKKTVLRVLSPDLPTAQQERATQASEDPPDNITNVIEGEYKVIRDIRAVSDVRGDHDVSHMKDTTSTQT